MKKESNLYKVNWNFTGLKPMNIAASYLLPAVLLAADVNTPKVTFDETKEIDVLFNTPDGNSEGDPLGSDIECDGDDSNEEFCAKERHMYRTVTTFEKIDCDDMMENQEIDGVLWERNATVPEPVGKSSFGGSTIKENYQHLFETELSSFLAFLPLSIWKKS